MKIPTEEVGGLIHPIGRRATKRKEKEQVVYPVLDLVTTEMSTLRATNVKNSTMFGRYVSMQENTANAALKAIELRDRQQFLKEREQCFKEMKCNDRFLGMNIAEMCPEDQARYAKLKKKLGDATAKNLLLLILTLL